MEPLHLLIHSLSPHEKRYVRLHFERQPQGKGSHLDLLYRALLAQPTYDEAALKQLFAQHPLRRQFAVHKHLLYHTLLRCLQGYHYAESPGMQVRAHMDKIELLVGKNMYVAALKLLRQTVLLAESLAQHGYLMELLNMERRIERHLDPLRFYAALPRIEAAARKIAAIQREESNAMLLYDRLFALAQSERRVEKAASSEELAAIGQQLEALELSTLPSFNTRVTLLNIKALHQQLLGDYSAMAQAYRELIDHWEAHPKVVEAEPQRYARAQVAWLNGLVAAGRVEAELPHIRALRRLPVQGHPDRARTVFQSFNIELLWHLRTRDNPAAVRFLATFTQRLPELTPHLDALRLASCYFNVAMLTFGESQYRMCLDWTQKLLLLKDLPRDHALQRTGMLLDLACSLEVGDFARAEAQLERVRRRLSKRDADWAFGKIVVAQVGQLVPHWGTAEQDLILQALHGQLSALEAKAQPVPMGLELLKAWSGRTSEKG